MKLRISDVVIDQSIDIRDRMDETTIRDYMDIFYRLPPVAVFDTPEGYLLADGFHRIAACQRLGRNEIEAEVRKGSRDDALEYAAYANASAALRLTPEERRTGIRRLHHLHPDWKTSRLAELMSCSEAVVRTATEAVRVRREAPSAVSLPDRHLEEIARAPREYWEPLSRAAEDREWTTEEVRVARSNLQDENLPVEHKQALLAGNTEPIISTDGEPAFLNQTVRRHLANEAEKDYLSLLEGAQYQMAQLRRFQAEEVVHGLETSRLASLVRGLPGDIEYLNDILRLGRQRLEMWELK